MGGKNKKKNKKKTITTGTQKKKQKKELKKAKSRYRMIRLFRTSYPSLDVEREGTDLRRNPAVERSDAVVWRRGPVSDRLGPPDGDADTSGPVPDHVLW